MGALQATSRSPAARVVRQLQVARKTVRPGQRMRFLFTLGKPGVRALDVPDQPDIHYIDVHRYRVLFEHAVQTVLASIQQSVTGGMDKECLYLFPTKKAELLAEGAANDSACTIYHLLHILAMLFKGMSDKSVF
jgi:hypothetical protein